MDVSQSHAPAVLPQGDSPRYPLWAPETICTLWIRGKSLVSEGIEPRLLGRFIYKYFTYSVCNILGDAVSN
jgi:hypothetical protein